MVVDYEKEGRIAIFTINRPGAFNAVNVQVFQELHERMMEFRDDPELWVGIITGARTRAFSAGADIKDMLPFAREHRDMSNVLEVFERYHKLIENIEEGESILKGDDDELKEIVKEELDGLLEDQTKLEDELKVLLIPKDPADQGSAILEIRAGAGGDEAALFAHDLYRMYVRFAERQNWKIEELSSSFIGLGGIKEMSFSIKGEGAYGKLKYESGVHRVQRVPATESSGRIHTSAATVAVLPEAEKIDVEIAESDLRIDTYRASGAGGQHVNKTDSAIRITHIPSGVVVACQDERSQHKNKEKALKILYSRLLQHSIDEQNAKVAAERRSQVSLQGSAQLTSTGNLSR